MSAYFAHIWMSNAINIIIVFLQAFITYGGLTNDQIVKHVMFLRVDGVSMSFQGLKYGFITFMKTQQYLTSSKSIVWHIKQTLQCKLCFSCQWFPYWKISFNHYISINLVPQNSHLNLQNLLKLWKLRDGKCFNMWKLGGTTFYSFKMGWEKVQNFD
jgi:hypothetical protein